MVIITLGLNKLALLGYFLLKILILSLVSSWFNRYRNTYEHNLCLDMLKEGFHQSFRELFNLMEKQKADIGRLGTDSVLSDQPLLENEPAKLDQLKHHLTTAEAAKRRGEKINSILSIRYSTNHCLVSSVGLGWSAVTGSCRLKLNTRGLVSTYTVYVRMVYGVYSVCICIAVADPHQLSKCLIYYLFIKIKWYSAN